MPTCSTNDRRSANANSAARRGRCWSISTARSGSPYSNTARPTVGRSTATSPTGAKIHVINFEHPCIEHWSAPGLTGGYEHTFVHAIADS
jgi:hypothetical protein